VCAYGTSEPWVYLKLAYVSVCCITCLHMPEASTLLECRLVLAYAFVCTTATKTICQLDLLWRGKLYMPEAGIRCNALNALHARAHQNICQLLAFCLDVLQDPKAYARTTRRSRKVGASGICFQDAFRICGTPKYTPEEHDTYTNWVQWAYGFVRSSRKQAYARRT
jgi:hypothetical protein